MCSRNKSNRRECNRKTRLQLFIVVLFVLVDRKPLGVQTDRLPDDDVAAECCRNKQTANQAWWIINALGYQNATTIGRRWSLNRHRNVSASDPAKPVARTAVVMDKQVIFCYDISEKIIFKTSSSAVAERPRDASYHCIFCKVTQGHSKWNCWVGRV